MSNDASSKGKAIVFEFKGGACDGQTSDPISHMTDQRTRWRFGHLPAKAY